MSLLPILHWPDALLSQRAAHVTSLSEAAALAEDMLATMYAAPGRGLAAPQVGRMLRLFVMDVGWKAGTAAPVVMVNPELLWSSEEVSTVAEGCLSIPGVLAEVTRPVAVRMRWTDPTGEHHERMLDGDAARCAQHEFDHLDGLVTLDRVDPETRRRLEAEYTA